VGGRGGGGVESEYVVPDLPDWRLDLDTDPHSEFDSGSGSRRSKKRLNDGKTNSQDRYFDIKSI
jgi:hypothetical protein